MSMVCHCYCMVLCSFRPGRDSSLWIHPSRPHTGPGPRPARYTPAGHHGRSTRPLLGHIHIIEDIFCRVSLPRLPPTSPRSMHCPLSQRKPGLPSLYMHLPLPSVELVAVEEEGSTRRRSGAHIERCTTPRTMVHWSTPGHAPPTSSTCCHGETPGPVPSPPRA